MSSKRQFAGRGWLGREYLVSLFTGVGTFVETAHPPLVEWTMDLTFTHNVVLRFGRT